MEPDRVRKENLTVAPCTDACPCHIDVPRYIRYIQAGKYDEALAVNREKIPFPSVCGQACFNPCELSCGYMQFGEPIAIRALKRAAIENSSGDLWKKNLKVESASGKKVGIVGAGPAGLTAAYFLATKGHDVTVYDAYPKAGGMMRYGIPRYRLPEESLDEDINEVLALGVKFEPNTAVGKDVSLSDLKQRFDAVFVASGAQLSRRIDAEGVDKTGVLWGVDFLRDVAQGKDVAIKDPVIVVGGGNVAVDVALTARRLGAQDVFMVCLERRDEMPAHQWELARAEEEGIKIHTSWGPQRFTGDGAVQDAQFKQCTSVFDRKGRRLQGAQRCGEDRHRGRRHRRGRGQPGDRRNRGLRRRRSGHGSGLDHRSHRAGPQGRHFHR
jgi:NADPH-dependent glutamate synthase beta subunit-like oxidoreductase